LKQKRKEVFDAKSRLESGLDVLANAQVEIDKLQKSINAAAPKLAATKKEVAETMAVIAVEKKDADEVKEVVAKDEAEASAQEAEASTLMAEAQTELNKAAPLLDAAAKVLNSLEKGDFYTLGGIKAPTPAVVAGMEAACIMLGVKPNKKIPDNQKL
jgi:dynein heavy chain